MNVKPFDVEAVLRAGKVPRHLVPWGRGEIFNAHRFAGTTYLFQVCIHGLMQVGFPEEGYGGYTVMEDSDNELRKHLEAVRRARGRVLKTGLGLGCFVRMCLTKENVEHIDVIEINKDILDHFGAEFRGNPRVTLHHADARTWPLAGRKWDFGWHDVYCEGNEGLQVLHVELLTKFHKNCEVQGAWGFPRDVRKKYRRFLV